jgi:hypothetical protein
MSNYENATPAEIKPGDVIFTGARDREVTAVEYRESYAAPGLKITRPAYLVTVDGYRQPKMYRPGATVIRKKAR